MTEVFIYFVCFVTSKPDVIACDDEICGHEWVSTTRGLRGIKHTTDPTQRLLRELENVDFGAVSRLIQL
jgi:hypothetical protein